MHDYEEVRLSQGSQSCYTAAVNIVLFEEEELASPLPLCDHGVKHIQKILRKGVGDCFEAGIVNGAAGTAEIAEGMV